jgi:hypothetical protein
MLLAVACAATWLSIPAAAGGGGGAAAARQPA